MITCQDLYEHLNSMLIDEERLYTLASYSKRKGKKVITQSDHNLILADFDIKYKSYRYSVDRIELFNLKNLEGQVEFKRLTENNEEFKDCLRYHDSIEAKYQYFMKALNNVLNKSFKKIRVKPKSIASKIQVSG